MKHLSLYQKKILISREKSLDEIWDETVKKVPERESLDEIWKETIPPSPTITPQVTPQVIPTLAETLARLQPAPAVTTRIALPPVPPVTGKEITPPKPSPPGLLGLGFEPTEPLHIPKPTITLPSPLKKPKLKEAPAVSLLVSQKDVAEKVAKRFPTLSIPLKKKEPEYAVAPAVTTKMKVVTHKEPYIGELADAVAIGGMSGLIGERATRKLNEKIKAWTPWEFEKIKQDHSAGYIVGNLGGRLSKLILISKALTPITAPLTAKLESAALGAEMAGRVGRTVGEMLHTGTTFMLASAVKKGAEIGLEKRLPTIKDVEDPLIDFVAGAGLGYIGEIPSMLFKLPSAFGLGVGWAHAEGEKDPSRLLISGLTMMGYMAITHPMRMKAVTQAEKNLFFKQKQQFNKVVEEQITAGLKAKNWSEGNIQQVIWKMRAVIDKKLSPANLMQIKSLNDLEKLNIDIYKVINQIQGVTFQPSPVGALPLGKRLPARIKPTRIAIEHKPLKGEWILYKGELLPAGCDIRMDINNEQTWYKLPKGIELPKEKVTLPPTVTPPKADLIKALGGSEAMTRFGKVGKLSAEDLTTVAKEKGVEIAKEIKPEVVPKELVTKYKPSILVAEEGYSILPERATTKDLRYSIKYYTNRLKKQLKVHPDLSIDEQAKLQASIETAQEELAKRKVPPIAELKAIPKELEPLAREARKYKGAEEFVNELQRVIKKYNSVTLRVSEAQRGLVARGKILNKTEDKLHFAYLKGLEEIGTFTKTGKLEDFYNLVTKEAPVPFMITDKMHAQLRGLGYTEAEIKKMKPEEVGGIIKKGAKKVKPEVRVIPPKVEEKITKEMVMPTIEAVVARRGIDPTSLKKDFPDFLRDDKGLVLRVVKKGGQKIDELAKDMQRAGELRVPTDRNSDDYLIEKLEYEWANRERLAKEIEGEIPLPKKRKPWEWVKPFKPEVKPKIRLEVKPEVEAPSKIEEKLLSIAQRNKLLAQAHLLARKKNFIYDTTEKGKKITIDKDYRRIVKSITGYSSLKDIEDIDKLQLVSKAFKDLPRLQKGQRFRFSRKTALAVGRRASKTQIKELVELSRATNLPTESMKFKQLIKDYSGRSKIDNILDWEADLAVGGLLEYQATKDVSLLAAFRGFSRWVDGFEEANPRLKARDLWDMVEDALRRQQYKFVDIAKETSNILGKRAKDIPFRKRIKLLLENKAKPTTSEERIVVDRFRKYYDSRFKMGGLPPERYRHFYAPKRAQIQGSRREIPSYLRLPRVRKQRYEYERIGELQDQIEDIVALTRMYEREITNKTIIDPVLAKVKKQLIRYPPVARRLIELNTLTLIGRPSEIDLVLQDEVNKHIPRIAAKVIDRMGWQANDIARTVGTSLSDAIYIGALGHPRAPLKNLTQQIHNFAEVGPTRHLVGVTKGISEEGRRLFNLAEVRSRRGVPEFDIYVPKGMIQIDKATKIALWAHLGVDRGNRVIYNSLDSRVKDNWRKMREGGRTIEQPLTTRKCTVREFEHAVDLKGESIPIQNKVRNIIKGQLKELKQETQYFPQKMQEWIEEVRISEGIDMAKKEAISFILAKEGTLRTQYPYFATQTPYALKGTMGRIIGTLGTWRIWFTEMMAHWVRKKSYGKMLRYLAFWYILGGLMTPLGIKIRRWWGFSSYGLKAPGTPIAEFIINFANMTLAGFQIIMEPSSEWKKRRFSESFKETRRGLWVFATWPRSIIQALTDKRLTERERVYRILSLPFDRKYATMSKAINGWIDKKQWSKISAYLTQVDKHDEPISNKNLNRIIKECPSIHIRIKARNILDEKKKATSKKVTPKKGVYFKRGIY